MIYGRVLLKNIGVALVSAANTTFLESVILQMNAT